VVRTAIPRQWSGRRDLNPSVLQRRHFGHSAASCRGVSQARRGWSGRTFSRVALAAPAPAMNEAAALKAWRLVVLAGSKIGQTGASTGDSLLRDNESGSRRIPSRAVDASQRARVVSRCGGRDSDGHGHTWSFKRLLHGTEERRALASCADLGDPLLRQRLQRYFDDKGTFPAPGADDEYAVYFEAAYGAESDRRRYISDPPVSESPQKRQKIDPISSSGTPVGQSVLRSRSGTDGSPAGRPSGIASSKPRSDTASTARAHRLATTITETAGTPSAA
jgi:hypothetical protein